MLFYLNYNTFITNEGVTTMLHPGLYEQVINNALTSELSGIPEARKAIAPINKAEAYQVLSQKLDIAFVNAGQWNVELTFDGVHFTEEGHRAFAEGLYRHLTK